MRHGRDPWALAFVFAWAIAGSAFGWGGEGHQIVALIAENHLSEQAKAAIHELLGADVKNFDVSAIPDSAVREISEGIKSRVRFNAVVETGVPGFIPRGK